MCLQIFRIGPTKSYGVTAIGTPRLKADGLLSAKSGRRPREVRYAPMAAIRPDLGRSRCGDSKTSLVSSPSHVCGHVNRWGVPHFLGVVSASITVTAAAVLLLSEESEIAAHRSGLSDQKRLLVLRVEGRAAHVVFKYSSWSYDRAGMASSLKSEV